MRARWKATTAILVATTALAIPAPSASAAPVALDAFYAGLTAAISQSGPLVPGTTLRYQESERTAPGARPVTRNDVVNPDGSLTLRRSSPGRVREVRCTGFDRCWERVTDRRSDRRWHLLQAGAIRYVTIVPQFVTPTRDLWPANATFDVTATPTGGQVFTARFPSGANTAIDRYTIEGPKVTRSLSQVSPDDKTLRSLTVSFTSQATPVTVTAPKRKTVGRPFTAKRTPGASYVRGFEAYANISS